MKKSISLILIIGLAVSLLFAGGCFNLGEKIAGEITEGIVEKAIEGESGADVDISGDSATVKTDEGETTIGSEADIPEGYPGGEVPVYPDMTLTFSQRITQDGKDSFMLSAETADAGQKIIDWYKSKLAGWDIDSEYSSESDDVKSTMVNFSNDSYMVWVQVTEQEDGNYVMLSVSEN